MAVVEHVAPLCQVQEALGALMPEVYAAQRLLEQPLARRPTEVRHQPQQPTLTTPRHLRHLPGVVAQQLDAHAWRRERALTSSFQSSERVFGHDYTGRVAAARTPVALAMKPAT